MVEVGLAFVAALVAWSATASQSARSSRDPRLYTWVWAVATAAVAIALTAAIPAALFGFSNVMFRLFQIGVALLGPLCLAWGAVEFAIASARGRFGVRLVVATLMFLPLTGLVLDPLSGSFGGSYPQASAHYDLVPMLMLGAVHVFASGALLVCLAVVALRMRAFPREAQHRMGTVLLLGLAALLEILVARLGLGVLGQLMLIGAVCATLVGAHRSTAAARRRGGRRGAYPEDEDDYLYDDEDRAEEDEVPRRRRSSPHAPDRGGDAGGGHAPPPPRRPRLRGIITVYTLVDGKTEAFDQVTDEVVEEVRRREPDTLLFTCHSVPNAPLQRIVYALYRDDLAYEEHEQQPHIVEFARQRAPYVVATNVIMLDLSGGKAEGTLAGMLAMR